MPAGKNRLKRHISAAKEWLGRAEKSLDQDNEVKGDLNLMLAQAELQRAKESKDMRKKSFLPWRHIASALVAVLLVWGGLGMMRDITGLNMVPASQPKTMVEEKPALPGTSADTVKPKPSLQNKNITEDVASQTVSAAAKSERQMPSEIAETKAETPAVPVASKQTAAVPPVEMQKLMRTAGKTLRSQ
jgi:hypothetical protein